LVTALDETRTQFAAGDYAAARASAVAGLDAEPDSIELLRIAGRAGVELGEPDAIDQLRRVTELAPDDAVSWRDLGDALATEGRDDEATEAFRKAVEIDPNDEASLTALGHSSYSAGRGDDALAFLEQAADRSEGMSTAVISLVDMYRTLGQHDEALMAARRIADAEPGDVMAALDVAELSLETGDIDQARKSFERIGEVGDLADDEVLALHGRILVELRQGDPGKALELAREAKAIDTVGRTTGVLAYLEVDAGAGLEDLPRDASAAFVAAIEAPPTREEVDAALQASLADLRRLHSEDRRLRGADILG
jgi:tetratricopeptide (TPR) repeat protein